MSEPDNSKLLRKANSKFKPAIAGAGGASSSTAAARKGIPSNALSAFSASPSIKRPVRNMSPPHVLEIPDSPSASLPTKRISSDSIDRAQGSALKRFKPSLPPAIDHSPQKFTNAKPSNSIRHWSLDRGETSSEVDSLNLGVGRTKFTADTFKFSRKPPPPSTSRPLSSPKSSPQKTSNDFSDLNSKSLDDLRSLLSSNESFRNLIGEMIHKHITKAQYHDVVTLTLFLSQMEDRIRSIEQRIGSTAVLQDTHPPPPSMTVSDSSNMTLDTTIAATAAPDLTQDTAMTIDSPDVAEPNSQEISTATLVDDDSDDAYYDKFDPIPADLVLFDTDKPEDPPPPGAFAMSIPASSSISAPFIPATPGGRIDHTSSPYYKEVISILKNTFKLSSFRTNQLESIIATLDGKDVFYLAPTGGGKSLCFQLPALCVTGKTQGTTFVISPLISLITDQVGALRKKGIPAFPLTSAAEENEVRQAMYMMRTNTGEKPKLVYTTPERLQKSDSLRDVVSQLYEEKQLARFVIDEAHVIGSWGRDFRASYAELNILRKSWPNVPIMALTGSANKDTIEDIKHNLAMRNPVCLAQSFNRPNLHYSIRKKPTLKKDLAQQIAGFIKTHHPTGTGIIYVLSRADTEEVAQKLREEWGIEARHYHAGIDNEERKHNQADWMSGRCMVIVATIAFGMGIDKPDVRFVIHATLSKDMDGYYQETGRAGRDGKSSDCVLFYAFNDVVKIEKMLRNPDPTRDKPSPSDSEIERQVSKLQGVVAYCSNESDCRRVLILRHFDEEFKPEDCHNQCDNCHTPGVLTQHDFTTEAKQIIQLLTAMTELNGRVTQGQLKDTWKGKNNKVVQPYKSLALYASGKALGHPTIERIFTHLTSEGAISMYRVQSNSGYSNTYIQCGSAGADYLDGNRQLVLSWKEKGDKDVPAKKGIGRPRKKGKEPDPPPTPATPLYRNLYEDIEDADEMSDSEVFKDAIDHVDVPEPSTSRVPQASTSRSAGSMMQSAPPATSEDAITARLRRLQETRQQVGDRIDAVDDMQIVLALQVAERWRKSPMDILQDHTLEILALTPPEDEDEFKTILHDNEDPKEVENKYNSFGYQFFAALKDLSRKQPFDALKMRRDFAYNV